MQKKRVKMKIFLCPCGARLSNQALLNVGYRCPVCGRHKTRRWRFVYEEMYVELAGAKQKQLKEMV